MHVILGLSAVGCGSEVIRPRSAVPINGWVAYCAPDSGSSSPMIRKIRLDGTGARRLSLRGWSCQWDPQGRRLSFADRVGFQFHIFITDSGGSGRIDLGRTNNTVSSWSLDGRQVLSDGMLRDATSGELLGWPPTPPQVFEGDSVYPAYPQEFVWDSGHVVVKGFDHHPGGQDSCRLHYDYYISDVHNGALVERLTKTRYVDCSDSVLCVSPDGRKILIRCGFASPRITVGVMDVGTQQVIKVTSGRVDPLAQWGSDNRSIVFMKELDPPQRVDTYSLFYTSLDSLGRERRILDGYYVMRGFDVHLDTEKCK